MIIALWIGLVLVFLLGLTMSANHDLRWSPAGLASLLCLGTPLGLSAFWVVWRITHSM